MRRAVGDPADISGSAPRDVMISQILLINDTFTWVPALLLNTNWSILRQMGRCRFPLQRKQCELTRGPQAGARTHAHTLAHVANVARRVRTILNLRQIVVHKKVKLMLIQFESG